MTTQPEEADSQFRRVDLHIHTPRSVCYAERSVTPEQIVETVLTTGLEIIGIMDHNTVQGIADVGDIAAERGLVLLPGIELATPQGHTLALFERNADLGMLQQFLRDVGIDKESEGDGTVPTKESMEEVFQRIDGLGGIAIAAHIDRWPTGFIETNEHRKVKMSIHESDYLSALEITQWNNKRQWTDGKVRGYPRQHACIQGSDAHALEDIGRRWTYMRMSRPDLDGLRRALRRRDDYIRFPHEVGDGGDSES